MLANMATISQRFVATQSSNPRALPAEELAARASSHFSAVETVPDPAAFLDRTPDVDGGNTLIKWVL